MTTLGWEPTDAEVILSRGADLIFNLPPVDNNGDTVGWPSGTTSTIVFYNQSKTVILTKAGVVAADRIDYIIQAEDLAPILGTAKKFDVLVSLPTSPTQEFTIYTGQVRRKDGAK